MEDLPTCKNQRSPIKKVGCFPRCGHAMYYYGVSIIMLSCMILLLIMFPYRAIYYTELNREFYNSLKYDICNISTVVSADQLPNISTTGWMPCKCGNLPSYMYCVEMYTNELTTSLVRPQYKYVGYYEHIHIPGQFDKCTFMGNCACTDSELNNQLNESMNIYKKYNNRLAHCYHDSNYKNIYLSLGKFNIYIVVGIFTILLLFLALVVLLYTLVHIGIIMKYVFGCREF